MVDKEAVLLTQIVEANFKGQVSFLVIIIFMVYIFIIGFYRFSCE